LLYRENIREINVTLKETVLYVVFSRAATAIGVFLVSRQRSKSSLNQRMILEMEQLLGSKQAQRYIITGYFQKLF
jgi:hypothetical protein